MTTATARATVQERLAQLFALHGTVTPELVIDDARDEESPLHSAFEWDDSVAAEAYRRQQARALIRSVEVVVSTETTTLRAPVYIHDPRLTHEVAGYVTIESLKSDRDASANALLYEVGRIESLLARARAIAAGLRLEADVDNATASVAVLREKAQQLAA